MAGGLRAAHVWMLDGRAVRPAWTSEGRGEVQVKKVLKWVLWLFLAFLVYSIFRSPEQAAGLVVGGFQGIASAIQAIFDFFDAVLAQSTGTAPPP